MEQPSKSNIRGIVISMVFIVVGVLLIMQASSVSAFEDRSISNVQFFGGVTLAVVGCIMIVAAMMKKSDN